MLNAIQPIDLRKSNVVKGIQRTIHDELAPGAARKAFAKIRQQLAIMYRRDRAARKSRGRRHSRAPGAPPPKSA